MSQGFNFNQVTATLRDFDRKVLDSIDYLASQQSIPVATSPRDTVYQEDKVKVYYYPSENLTCETPLILIWPLFNHFYVFDLHPDLSFVRALNAQGVNVYVVDWGTATRADMHKSMEDYILGYLNNVVNAVQSHSNNSKVSIFGFCQAAVFAIAYASLYGYKVKNLITAAIPAECSLDHGLIFKRYKKTNIKDRVEFYQSVPGHVFNADFFTVSPFFVNIKKYFNAREILGHPESLMNFLRVEKWVYDSPDQAGACMQEFFHNCYIENKFLTNQMKLGDHLVDLAKVTAPLLNISGEYDDMIGKSSSMPLADALPNSQDKTFYLVPAGHIGLVISRRSYETLVPTLGEWLHNHD